jgi:hypothetical protein
MVPGFFIGKAGFAGDCGHICAPLSISKGLRSLAQIEQHFFDRLVPMFMAQCCHYICKSNFCLWWAATLSATYSTNLASAKSLRWLPISGAKYFAFTSSGIGK